MFTAENLPVHILDFDKANSILTSMLNTDSAANRKFYFGVQHCGLVDVNNRYFLVTPRAHMHFPQINDIKKPETLFELVVFEEISDIVMLKSLRTANLPLKDIEDLKTGVEVSLRKFMGPNYNASQTIFNRIEDVLFYANSQANKNKYTLR